MYFSIRSPGRRIDYYVNDKWILLFSFSIGLSICLIIKLLRSRIKIKTEGNSCENKPTTIPNPRGGDYIVTLAKVYEKCLKPNSLYLIRNKKVAAVARKLLKTGASKQSIVISVGLYLYALGIVGSKSIVLNAGNSEYVVTYAKKMVLQVPSTFILGPIIAMLPPAGIVGAISLFGLMLISATERIDCNKFVTEVSRSQDEIHHLMLPEPKQPQVYITGKDKVQIYEDIKPKPNSDLIGSEQISKSPSSRPIYQRYIMKNKNKPLKERTKYLSDLPELDPVLDYEVENAMTQVDKNNKQYIKEMKGGK